ncbi:MAG: hypothetical protein J1F11_01705 [Oscillospiraceae bacterium]|nr:hypothetical protein [Oscillospiraceae bacterium]
MLNIFSIGNLYSDTELGLAVMIITKCCVDCTDTVECFCVEVAVLSNYVNSCLLALYE